MGDHYDLDCFSQTGIAGAPGKAPTCCLGSMNSGGAEPKREKCRDGRSRELLRLKPLPRDEGAVGGRRDMERERLLGSGSSGSSSSLSSELSVGEPAAVDGAAAGAAAAAAAAAAAGAAALDGPACCCCLLGSCLGVFLLASAQCSHQATCSTSNVKPIQQVKPLGVDPGSAGQQA
jgi:hypothetical protein